MHGAVLLDRHSSGCPIDLTRVVAVGGRNVAVIHGVGPGPAGGGIVIGHPDTTKGGGDSGMGTPMILTRGLGAVGLACPPWTQVTIQFMFSRYPAIR
jgi:hypothetical protein